MTDYVTVTADTNFAPDGSIKLYGSEDFAGIALPVGWRRRLSHARAACRTWRHHAGARRFRPPKRTLEGGAMPATTGYRGYTHICCISINHVVCHGIPGAKDAIVNIAVTPLLDGWHGDTSHMYLVGDVPLKAKRLVNVT